MSSSEDISFCVRWGVARAVLLEDWVWRARGHQTPRHGQRMALGTAHPTVRFAREPPCYALDGVTIKVASTTTLQLLRSILSFHPVYRC